MTFEQTGILRTHCRDAFNNLA